MKLGLGISIPKTKPHGSGAPSGTLVDILTEYTPRTSSGWDTVDITNHVKNALFEGLSNVDILLKYKTIVGLSDGTLTYWAREYAVDTNLRPYINIDGTTIVANKDVEMLQDNPTTNYNSNAYMRLRNRTSYTYNDILSFSLSGIGACTAASINLYNAFRSGTYNVTVQVVKLSRSDWVEAEATWNIYKTGSNWTSAGGDFETTGLVAP